jgi:RNA polymerase sigma factor (sigma-70 family)
MRAKRVLDFYEPVDCEIQAMTTAIQRGDRGVQLDADFSPGIEIIEGWSVLTEPDIRGALPALQKYARALTRHVGDAEDLVQDTLTQAWAKRAHYYGGDARAWLFTVMHNLHVSKIRRRSKPGTLNVYPPAEDSPLADAAFFRLVVRHLARELRTMPEGMRQAVMLAAASTDDYRGMAARLNVNLGTFRSRLSRGRQRLRMQFYQ